MTICPIEKRLNNIQTNTAVELRSVSKKYPFPKTVDNYSNSNFTGFWALKDVSLEIYQGEILGVIGRNGAGKTTLLNIITGFLSPTDGRVFIKGKVLGLFNLGVGFQDELTGRENIFLNGAIIGATKKELENKLNLIIEFSELGEFIDMPLGTYSQGMRLRLAFSIIANLDFDTMLIDEVLAVGDALFQSKCFQRLMDFKRAGKTLIITTQSMDLIERLCDKVILMDHGHLLFKGNVIEGINKYLALLNTEKFFVGPGKKNIELVENTKKWAEDISGWGRKLGTKEVEIKSVELINKFGLRTNCIKSREPLKIRVSFEAKNTVKEPHFGIAIFRKDGVYCYGPNTKFDGYEISELSPGNGYFVLNFRKLLLAPGEYRISVAIWDKNETLAFNYHEGCYKLIIAGNRNTEKELLNIPFRLYPRNYLNFRRKNRNNLDLSILNAKWGQKIEIEEIKLESVRLLNHLGAEKAVFMTNEPVTLMINFSKFINPGKKYYLWAGLYRDDGIYCQGIMHAINRSNIYKVMFPELSLSPGGYRISLGIWDSTEKKFIICHHAVYSFRMIFNREDHGTVYLEHKWRWGVII